jgi:GATA zinc finger
LSDPPAVSDAAAAFPAAGVAAETAVADQGDLADSPAIKAEDNSLGDPPGAMPNIVKLEMSPMGQPTRPRRTAASQRIPANVLIGADPLEPGADAPALPGAPSDSGPNSGASSWAVSGAGPSSGSSRPLKTNLVSGGPCVECQAVKSTLFRKTPDGQPLCNACGLRLAREMQKQQNVGQRSDTGGGKRGSPPYSASPGRGRGVTKTGPGARGRRRKLPPDGRRKCAICGATNSPQWRYIQEEDIMACNACALRRYRTQERKQQAASTAVRPAR